MLYGVRVSDAAGNSAMLTDNIAKIIAGGNISMSNSLEGDGTYGEDIDLPGTEPLLVSSIGVLVFPTKFTYQGIAVPWAYSGDYPFSWYADSDGTYYTKNDSTGVMTSWSAGIMTEDAEATWDPICSMMPLTGWDYADGVTRITSVRLWAATTYVIYDSSATAFKAVYSIGDLGVSEVNYSIFLRKH